MDVDEWQSFAEYGRKSQQAQLDLLELERVDTITSFNEKKGWLFKKTVHSLIIFFNRIFITRS